MMEQTTIDDEEKWDDYLTEKSSEFLLTLALSMVEE